MTDSDEPEIKPIPAGSNNLFDEFQTIRNECFQYAIKSTLITDKEILQGSTPQGALNYYQSLIQREGGGEND